MSVETRVARASLQAQQRGSSLLQMNGSFVPPGTDDESTPPTRGNQRVGQGRDAVGDLYCQRSLATSGRGRGSGREPGSSVSGALLVHPRVELRGQGLHVG